MQEKELLNKIKMECKNNRAVFKGKMRCFWTRPFGHIWTDAGTSYDRICAICGAFSCRGNYDGDWRYDISTYSNHRDKSELAFIRKKRRLGID